MTKHPPLPPLLNDNYSGRSGSGRLAPLDACARRHLAQYFEALGDQEPRNLYQQVLEAVERPLVNAVLEQTQGNQTRAAEILGITRGTLRKRMKRYGQI